MRMPNHVKQGPVAFFLALCVLLQAPVSCCGARAEVTPIRIVAAGSLNAPLKEILAGSGIARERLGEPVFGPSGLLREKLQAGETADLFLSADVSQPEKLKAGGRALLVIPFARNKLCVLSRDRVALTDANLLDKLLDPSVRLATSTPKADPSGDYTWAMFARAEAIHPGARKTLEDKALQLFGGPSAPVPAPGTTMTASIFLADKADVVVSYCSGLAATLKNVPGLTSRRLPAALDVTATYGLAVMSESPEAERLALFIVSEGGQAILQKNGLLPVAETESAANAALSQSKPATARGLALQREASAPAALSPDQIAALPHVTQRVVQKTSHGEEATEWSGPLLWNVLTSAGIMDPAKHGEHPRLIIRASGKDGYTVTLSGAEISPEFEDKQVIVADRLNGAALPDGALRLVVPGDHRAGRSVRDLVRITVDR